LLPDPPKIARMESQYGLSKPVPEGISRRHSERSAPLYIANAMFLPTGLLGVGLEGDSTPRMIAFQMRMEF